MTQPLDLNRLRVAGPCDRTWESLTPVDGNDRAHFCDECQRHVHDLAALNRREAETLLTTAEGRLCMLVTRRPDGTVVTRDPPQPVLPTWRRWWAAAVALLSLGLGTSACQRAGAPDPDESASPPTADRVAVPVASQPFDPGDPAQLAGTRSLEEGACEEELDPETIEQLRSLGYIEID